MKPRRPASSGDSDRESETVITFANADGGLARVYTCQPPMMRLLRRHPHARLLEEHRSESGALTGVEFEVPVACFAVLSRPRASAWERMLRAGPRARAPRRRSLISVRNGQSGAPGVGPGGEL